jgi:hypothetical protein
VQTTLFVTNLSSGIGANRTGWLAMMRSCLLLQQKSVALANARLLVQNACAAHYENGQRMSW